jgi:CRISPR-associated RAMP protein (TIGR02581 family)
MTTNDFSKFHGRLELLGRLVLLTPLQIGSGIADDMFGADLSVVKDAFGRPYIPGSSFKGVLRSYVESVLRAHDERLACLCVTDQPDHSCPTPQKHALLEQRAQHLIDNPPDNVQLDQDNIWDYIYLQDTCRVCQVFGANGLASKVLIPDLPVDDATWAGHYQIRHGVSIDRDTGTQAAQRLFNTEAVPAGTAFHCRVFVENGSLADQGLVLLGLKAFERSLVTLGGAASRGLGQIQLQIDSCLEIPADSTQLIDFLAGGAALEVSEQAQLDRIQALRDELEV